MLASSGVSEADRSLRGKLDIHREVQASQGCMTRPFLNNKKNTNKTTRIQAHSAGFEFTAGLRQPGFVHGHIPHPVLNVFLGVIQIGAFVDTSLIFINVF